MGRTCNEPIQLHYFPTLHHLQYEAEDGLTAQGQTVRYRWEENEFANFSWKGYVFFTVPQVRHGYGVVSFLMYLSLCCVLLGTTVSFIVNRMRFTTMSRLKNHHCIAWYSAT